MADDRVTAELAAIRGLVARRDRLVARAATVAVDVLAFNAAQDRLAERVPRLLAAVEAAREIHRPDGEMGVDAIWCASCGIETDWPCPTLAAIERALTGEDVGGRD